MRKHVSNRRSEGHSSRQSRQSKRRDAFFHKITQDKLSKQEKNTMGRMKALLMEQQEAMIDCPECAGEGRCEYEREVPMSNSNPYGYLEDYWAECGNCQGTGQIEEDSCG